MSEISLPLLGVDGVDIQLFGSFRDAEECIEPIDVKSGDVLFFDARGAQLSVVVSTGRRYLFDVDREHPEGRAMLESTLRAYLARLPSRLYQSRTDAAEAESLSALITLFVPLERGEAT